MNKPKVLIWDCETAPNLGYTWGQFDQNVIAFKEEWYLLSFAYKWLGESKVTVHSVRTCGSERALCKKLRTLIQQADITVAHNGDKFDVRKAKTRLAFHGLTPTKVLATIDTLKEYRKHFNLNSYSLRAIADYFDFKERKFKDVGISVWLGCMRGDKKSWAVMEKYNAQDVRVEEEAYKFVLPWMHKHPSMALLQGHKGCPKCGSSKVKKQGVRGNTSGVQQQWQCNDCKGWYLTGMRVK